MSAALDRLLARNESLISKVENGEPIDYPKEARLDALDMVAAGIEFTQDAIERTTEADEQADERNSG